MADNYRTERVDPSWQVQEFPQGHDGPPRRRLPPHAYEQAPAKPHPQAADVASVLGLPAESISTAVLEAVVPLLAEIDRLHWVAEQAEHRAAWTERQSDSDPVVPCLNRHAFLRALDSFLMTSGNDGTLAVVQVCGVEKLRRDHGLAAGDAAMRHIAATLVGGLRTSDMIGCLGGSDFAVLLPATSMSQAHDKLDVICGRIITPAFVWSDEGVTLAAAFGLAPLQAGDSGEAAMAVADLSRRNGQGESGGSQRAGIN